MCVSGHTLDDKTGSLGAKRGNPLLGSEPRNLVSAQRPLQGIQTLAGSGSVPPLTPSCTGLGTLNSVAVGHAPGHWGLLSFCTGPFASTPSSLLSAGIWSPGWSAGARVERGTGSQSLPSRGCARHAQAHGVFTQHPTALGRKQAGSHLLFNTRNGSQEARGCVLGQRGSCLSRCVAPSGHSRSDGNG